jgi:hypothetical protein
VNTHRSTIALIIWWCEGTKLRKDKRWKNSYLYPIEVINSDPRIIKIFSEFLQYDLGVEIGKLKGQIQIHEGDDQEEIELFWENATGIPRSQFNKTIIRSKGNKPGKNKGTFKLRTYNKALYEKLMNLLKEQLLNISESGSSSDG